MNALEDELQTLLEEDSAMMVTDAVEPTKAAGSAANLNLPSVPKVLPQTVSVGPAQKRKHAEIAS